MKKVVKVLLAVVMVILLSASTVSVSYAEAKSTEFKVKLNKTNVTLYVGQTMKLKIKGTNKKVTWSSSDKKVVKVNKNGKITAIKKGKANITAKVGGKKYTCKVNVKEVTYKTVFLNGSMLPSINTIQFSTKEIRQYSDGSYEVDAYIYNGHNHPVGNIEVTNMTLSDKNYNEVAAAAFKISTDLVISGQSYVVWTFRFNSQHTKDGDFDFSFVNLNTSFKYVNYYY